MPNIRLADGLVKQETRQRLMLAFNTPFFPKCSSHRASSLKASICTLAAVT